MSRLLGSPQERWSLAQAVDALVHAAGRAGRPSMLWIVGLVYPSLNLSMDLVVYLGTTFGEALGIGIFEGAPAGSLFRWFTPRGLQIDVPGLVPSFLAAVLVLLASIPLFRLIVGLARLVDPGPWGEHRKLDADGRARLSLKRAWAEGSGQGLVACGMSILLNVFVGMAFLVLLGPWLALHQMLSLPAEVAPIFAALLVPFLALVWAYAVVLQVVHQLALMSLAHNRRGVLSALTHGWRLVRASPWAAVRALVVDLSLFITQVVAVVVFSVGFLPFGFLLAIATAGFVGVTRAAYWAEVYRALGGASTVEPRDLAEPSPASA